MTFHIEPKPKPRRSATSLIGLTGMLIIFASGVGVIAALAIAAIRGLLGA